MSGERVAGFLVLLAVASASTADSPAFDRPGIAFAPSTLPAGSWSWEQGLPDFVRDSAGGRRSKLYSADTNVRIGLGTSVEMQASVSSFNYLDTDLDGHSRPDEGIGDAGLAVKIALPSLPWDVSWAALASVSFPTGEDPFTAHQRQYDLGVSLGKSLSDDCSAEFYVDATHVGSDTVWTLSPSLGFSLGPRLGTYVEAGVSLSGESDSHAVVAGGGLTWLLRPTVQLDLSADFGLNHDAPDVTGGFGISVFLP